MMKNIREKYMPLIKTPQTLLLLLTGIAGYLTARCPIFHMGTVLALGGSLFLAISGSTVLNMWYDRDIDAQMARTCKRPMAAKWMPPREGFLFGLILSVLGVGWALLMDPLYGLLVFGGLFFDVVIYTMWLKRRTEWAILWGGISGGMPVLAGRALGLGQLDWIGISLALAILFWIPTHILTFSIRYFDEYQAAGIPTFPSRCGFQTTRVIIAVSSILAALAMGLSAYGIGLSWGFLRLIGVLSLVLFVLAVRSMLRPSEKCTFHLFKYASIYMMGSMLLL
ncbi:MAG: protoheme IX farnesyltransferase, partial [Anaerolineales bacterium]|nr:protoheme IX farnesyltransferase [Anaerolineales bacterium]